MTARRQDILAGAVAAALLVGDAVADSWVAPHEADYYSATGSYCFHVVPGDGMKPPQGTLSRVIASAGEKVVAVREEEIWSQSLPNEVAPVEVLVASDGRYVVTFDEWGRVGWGPNVVVIYGPAGEIVKRFALEDILKPEEVAALVQTVSSRWWGGKHYLDEEAGDVVLLVATGRPDAAGNPGYVEKRVKLATGERR